MKKEFKILSVRMEEFLGDALKIIPLSQYHIPEIHVDTNLQNLNILNSASF